MPQKSHPSAKLLPRPSHAVVRVIENKRTFLYPNFVDFCKQVEGLKSIEDWNVKHLPDGIILKKVVDPFLLPQLEVIVDDSLGFTVRSYACYLPGSMNKQNSKPKKEVTNQSQKAKPQGSNA